MEPPVDTEESQNSITTGKEQSFKRIACDICRGRKVRCDRIHPVCGRCQRLGHKCEYTTHRKPDAVKPNICHTLDVLNERLSKEPALMVSLRYSGLRRGMKRSVWLFISLTLRSPGRSPVGVDTAGHPAHRPIAQSCGQHKRHRL